MKYDHNQSPQEESMISLDDETLFYHPDSLGIRNSYCIRLDSVIFLFIVVILKSHVQSHQTSSYSSFIKLNLTTIESRHTAQS